MKEIEPVDPQSIETINSTGGALIADFLNSAPMLFLTDCYMSAADALSHSWLVLTSEPGLLQCFYGLVALLLLSLM